MLVLTPLHATLQTAQFAPLTAHAPLAHVAPSPELLPLAAAGGCSWWNLACRGGATVANAGMSAITRSIASGAETLLGEILKVVDSSSQVPLQDPTYRHIYAGFLGLAAPLIGVVLCLALIVAAVRRDPGTLARATVGIAVAATGGAFYIVFAQLLIALDDWLSHGVVEVTGYDLTHSIDQLAAGFHQVAGAPGDLAANMLLILLMLIMLVAGLLLWFVLILRKVAILVVVAFAPLLIAGYLWAPTRAWVRKATEVLIALVFTKTAIFTLFGIGLALLARGTDQSLSDFVGETVLMCGACFAPLMMLRLVHFAADTHLAHDAMGTLRAGAQPVTSRLAGRSNGTGSGGMSRTDMARSQGQGPRPDAQDPVLATRIQPGGGPPPTPPAGTAATSAGGGAGSGAVGAAAGGVAIAGQAALDQARAVGHQAQGISNDLAGTTPSTTQHSPYEPHGSGNPDPADPRRPGPSAGDLASGVDANGDPR
jgi:type IV secretion system protein TrbL